MKKRYTQKQGESEKKNKISYDVTGTKEKQFPTHILASSLSHPLLRHFSPITTKWQQNKKGNLQNTRVKKI